jgi:hypothetical protein
MKSNEIKLNLENLEDRAAPAVVMSGGVWLNGGFRGGNRQALSYTSSNAQNHKYASHKIVHDYVSHKPVQTTISWNVNPSYYNHHGMFFNPVVR